MAMTKKSIEFFNEELGAKFKPEENKYICETAGYVPLEVKFRRYQEAGQIMQFSTSEFTSKDYRDMYLTPDLEITPEDDLEEIQEKLYQRQKFIKELTMKKLKVVDSEGIDNQSNDSAAAETKELTEKKDVDSEKK